MQPSARKFGNAVRKCLVAHPTHNIIGTKTKTTSFGGMGMGDGIFAELECLEPISDEQRSALALVRDEFEVQADEGNHFIISLGGRAYPFGGKI